MAWINVIALVLGFGVVVYFLLRIDNSNRQMKNDLHSLTIDVGYIKGMFEQAVTSVAAIRSDFDKHMHDYRGGPRPIPPHTDGA